MNILFPYNGISFGGSNVSSIILYEDLKKKYNLHLFLFQKGKFSDYLDKKSIGYNLFKPNSFIVEGTGILRLLRIILTLTHVSFLLKKKITVVHTNEIDMHLTWFLPCLLTGTKHIWHQRTPNNRSIYLSYFSKVIAVSNFTKKSFPSFIQKKSHMVYNPYIIKEYPKKILPSQPFKLAFVGNLVPRKKVMVFIEIIKHLELNVEGYIFGDLREPEYTKARRKIKDYQLEHKVNFMGLVMPLEEQLKKMDLVISPATHEALGRNIIESMSLGIPVLALDSGGNNEIISNDLDGYLIANNDTLQYVKHIHSLLSSPEKYTQISINAIEKVSSKFNATSHIKQMNQIYKDIKKNKS